MYVEVDAKVFEAIDNYIDLSKNITYET